MTHPLTTTRTILRITDILCSDHRTVADDGITWPFGDNNLATPRANCHGCREVFHDLQEEIDEGNTAHIVVFPDLPKHDRHALFTAHEAGHVVAGLAHGLTVNTAYVDTNPTADRGGYTAYRGAVDAYRPNHVADAAYAITLMAGTAATEHHLARLDSHRLTAADRIELAFQSRGDVDKVQALGGIDTRDALDQARQFVAAHWDVIEAVSQHLHTHHHATGTDLAALCGDLTNTKEMKN